MKLEGVREGEDEEQEKEAGVSSTFRASQEVKYEEV
jgi:hypothetical protein